VNNGDEGVIRSREDEKQHADEEQPHSQNLNPKV